MKIVQTHQFRKNFRENYQSFFLLPCKFSQDYFKLCQKQQILKTATCICFCVTHIFAKTFGETNIFAKTFATTKIFFGVGGWRDDLPSFSFSLTRMSFSPWISSFLDSFSPCNRGGAQEKQRQKQILSFSRNICCCMDLDLLSSSMLIDDSGLPAIMFSWRGLKAFYSVIFLSASRLKLSLRWRWHR